MLGAGAVGRRGRCPVAALRALRGPPSLRPSVPLALLNTPQDPGGGERARPWTSQFAARP